LQPVAINRKRTAPEKGGNKPNPLRPVATGCLRSSMVRRGSTVRVRQRALQKPRKAGLLLSCSLARSTACGGYGALYGAFRSRSVSVSDQKWPHCRHDVASATIPSCRPPFCHAGGRRVESRSSRRRTPCKSRTFLANSCRRWHQNGVMETFLEPLAVEVRVRPASRLFLARQLE
jgi:hypothetical protein